MRFFLLDAGGAFLGVFILIIFITIAILLEGVVLILFKIEKPGKCFLYSMIVNLASLGAGYIILPLIQQIGNEYTTSGRVIHWAIAFAITVLVEGFLLILLTKKKPKEKVWLATIVMNLLSYAVLFLFFGAYALG